MKSIVSAMLVAIFCAAATVAQNPFAPVKQLRKYDILVGSWDGKGTAGGSPNAERIPWTSKSSYEWVLGGHFLRETTRIEFDNEAFTAPLQVICFYGWDRGRKSYMSCSTFNYGKIDIDKIDFRGNTMTVVQSGTDRGRPFMARWTSSIAGDRMTLNSQRAEGNDAVFTHVKGVMNRTSAKPSTVTVSDASFMVPQAAQVMQRLAPMAGTYRFKGTMIPAPGAPEMSFSGTDTCNSIFGGMIFEVTSQGDPTPQMGNFPWQGLNYFAWDEANGGLVNFSMNNMGGFQHGRSWWTDQGLIGVQATRQGGVPTVMRSVLLTDDAGAIAKIWLHSTTGASDPVKSFEATYTKKN